MPSPKTHTQKAFLSSISILGLAVLMLVSHKLSEMGYSEFFSILFAVLLFVAIVLGFTGSLQSIKALKEPTSRQSLFALMINFGTVLLFIFYFIANMVEGVA